MTVRVGSSSDPSNAHGLAHLLEHMLFTGSKAYPLPSNKESLSKLKNDKLIELLKDLFDKSFVSSSMCLVFLGKVEDIHFLDITWNIPPISYMNRPEQFLVVAFTHKGEGSLHSVFKKKGWLISLEASSGDYKFDEDDDESKGTYACTSVFDIVGYVYHYLQFLRDNDAPWIMEDFFLIRNIKSRCFDTYDLGSDPFALTKQLAVNMLHMPLEDVVCADFLNPSCTRESIIELLECFKPRTMRLDLVSKSFDGEDLLEPKFNTFYKELEISPRWIGKWLNPCYEELEISSRFQFPPKNQFLPTLVPVYNDDGNDLTAEEAALFVDKSSIKLWHIRDDSVPTFNFSVYCNIGDDVKSQVLGVFYLHLLKDSLAPIFSEGKRANLSTSVAFSDKNKIEIKTSGFKERFHLYISKIWNIFTSFSPSSNRFMTDKEIVGTDLKNNVVELHDHSKRLKQEMVSTSCHPVAAMLNVLKLVTFDDMTNFISVLRSQMFIEGVFFGNILREEARNISELFKSDEIAPLHKDCRDDLRVYIPLASVATKYSDNTVDDFVRIKSDINSLATLSFQIGTETVDGMNTALLQLFYSLTEQNTIHVLREKNNLGYEVGSELDFKDGIKIFTINVISSTHNPEYLLEQIRKYVKGLEIFLEGVEADVFENHKKAIRGDYPDDDGENLWDQVTEKRLFPGFNKEVRRSLKKIVKEDLISFYKKYFIEASPDTRTLSIRIWGCNNRTLHV
ncbi:hypothetical protein Bca52824_019612 [Brassica carinata]|uniref:Uncharacterized protein n=1 Tax=Brassica carinata TaxID=52824 RepID=A0A8X7VSF8_BRACI|nr:hypothetical protein Bca52824_019612 [Brassica carinata]